MMTKCWFFHKWAKPRKYEYTIIRSNHHDYYGNYLDYKETEFFSMVGKMINDGWVLNGAPFFGGKHGTNYIQSMYREIK